MPETDLRIRAGSVVFAVVLVLSMCVGFVGVDTARASSADATLTINRVSVTTQSDDALTNDPPKSYRIGETIEVRITVSTLSGTGYSGDVKGVVNFADYVDRGSINADWGLIDTENVERVVLGQVQFTEQDVTIQEGGTAVVTKEITINNAYEQGNLLKEKGFKPSLVYTDTLEVSVASESDTVYSSSDEMTKIRDVSISASSSQFLFGVTTLVGAAASVKGEKAELISEGGGIALESGQAAAEYSQALVELRNREYPAAQDSLEAFLRESGRDDAAVLAEAVVDLHRNYDEGNALKVANNLVTIYRSLDKTRAERGMDAVESYAGLSDVFGSMFSGLVRSFDTRKYVVDDQRQPYKHSITQSTPRNPNRWLQVTVKNQNIEPVTDATVKFYDKNPAEFDVAPVRTAQTGESGATSISGPENAKTYWVDVVRNGESILGSPRALFYFPDRGNTYQLRSYLENTGQRPELDVKGDFESEGTDITGSATWTVENSAAEVTSFGTAGGLHLQAVGGTFESIDTGDFDVVRAYDGNKRRLDSVDGAKIVELTVSDRVSVGTTLQTGEIRIDTDGSATPGVEYRGWAYDNDATYNYEEIPGYYISRSPGGPTYNRHVVEPSYTFLNYPATFEEVDVTKSPPTLVGPSDGASDVSTDVRLRWEQVETEQYTVRLEAGDASPDRTVQTGLSPSVTEYTTNLDSGTTYYWQVVAVDGNGNTYPSPVRSFTTRDDSTSSPPALSGPSSGVESVPYSFTARAQSDAGELYYVFDWGDGTQTRFPDSGTVSGDVEATLNHVWGSTGTYTIDVKTVTSNGETSAVASTEIRIDQATVSDRVYAGRDVSGELDLDTSPPYSSYSVGEYTLKTVDISDESATLDIYRDGQLEYDDVRVQEGDRETFFNEDLIVLPESMSSFLGTATEFYYIVTRTDPSVVTVSPSSPTVTQGQTVPITLEFPAVSNPDSGVCGPESYIYGGAKEWVIDDSEWIDNTGSAFDGRALEIDADCTEFSDGEATVELDIPNDATTGEYELDIFFDTGKDAVYRMDGIEIDVEEGNSLPREPSTPEPSDGASATSTAPTLDWTGSDPDGDSLRYSVKLERGDTTPDTEVATGVTQSEYKPGGLEPDTVYYWQVVATDPSGASVSGPVWSFQTESLLPTAKLGADPASVVAGESLTLDASDSVNPAGDNSALDYSWTASAQSGDVDLPTPSGAGEVVVIDEPGVYTYEVTVANEYGTSTSSTPITVDVPDTDPTADAGSNRTVIGQSSVTLDGLGSSDEDGDPLAYEWTQVSGPTVSVEGGATPLPTFTAPQVDSVTTLEFELEVSDIDGMSATDTVVVTVEPRSTETPIEPLTPDTAPPTDPDNDGKYEDVDGNGEFTFFDILTLYDYFQSADSSIVDPLDFDDNGDLTFFDVLSLYDEFQS